VEIKEGLIYKFETPNCPTCKIVERYLGDACLKRKIQVEKINIADNDDAINFLQEKVMDTSLPVLLFSSKGELHYRSGLLSQADLWVFANEFIANQ